jgi:hypothetical protein
LDSHLAANESQYSSNATTRGYYAASTKRSPVKKAVEKVTELVTSGDESDKKAASRRKTTSVLEYAQIPFT